MKVISYCLYGNDSKYINGVERNLNTIITKLTDYDMFLYVPKGYSVGLECEKLFVKEVENPKHHSAHMMFYRFLPVFSFYEEIGIAHSRDIDSPILDREIAAMLEFEQSDKKFHIMRDHPWHKTRILGGMFGAKKGALSLSFDFLTSVMDRYKQEWYSDQKFLQSYVYPLVRDVTLIHDSFCMYSDENDIRKDFPTTRKDDEFVGMVLDADGSRVERFHQLLTSAK